ncbi:hypothetical protein G6N82_07465 [Altererythrobacter sp. BO-6]|uniref:hypothetical protein n=1 Tax=Altererythrobacter sp. BO-6 TaxID=2604537 RepID=UPI0013E1BB7B|nr:hypothetical protein [Altererythrobacter sp. BO-6]QIG54010.1 hypothetical protein G6N82_07465 [Altererythrobacter sp. BO-6]
MELKALAPHWVGHLFGTNTGRLHLALDSIEEDATARRALLRISDDNFGVSEYLVEVTISGHQILIAGSPKDQIEGFEQGTIEAKASFGSRGELQGDWSSSIGTGGTFNLFPHLGSAVAAMASGPEQLYTSNRDLGALRLYRTDLVEILANLRRKFSGSRIVVTHIDRGAELARFDDQFEDHISQLEKLDWIKFSVNTPTGSGLTRSLTIDLGQSFNRITAQGPDEAWVLGEVEATASSLRRRQQNLSTAIGKHKLNFNALILLAALVAMPDLALPERAYFILGVVGLIVGANKIADRLVPNFQLDAQHDRPRLVGQIWPSLLSWTISVSSAVAASFLFQWLS